MILYTLRLRAAALASHAAPIWSDLGKLGDNSVVRSSLAWMFIVPIAAKVLEPLDSLHFSLGGKEMSINLALPFSWTYLYVAALSFGLATLIYSVSCPRFIRQYQSPAVLRELGKGSRTVLDYFLRATRNPDAFLSECTVLDARLGFATRYLHYGDDPDSLEKINATFESGGIGDSTLDEAFWHLHGFCETHWPVRRLLIAALYLLGSVALALVVIRNSMYVFAHASFAW